MKSLIKKFAQDESGATAIEYGLIVALISIVIIAMVGFVGDELLKTFTKIRDELVTANTP